MEFNNGFITAIALFLEHKNFSSHMIRDNAGKVTHDMRLYGATDHLFNIEIPFDCGLGSHLETRIVKWREKCLHHRLTTFEDTKITSELFKEGEDILAMIDKIIFKTKRVQMTHR